MNRRRCMHMSPDPPVLRDVWAVRDILGKWLGPPARRTTVFRPAAAASLALLPPAANSPRRCSLALAGFFTRILFQPQLHQKHAAADRVSDSERPDRQAIAAAQGCEEEVADRLHPAAQAI